MKNLLLIVIIAVIAIAIYKNTQSQQIQEQHQKSVDVIPPHQDKVQAKKEVHPKQKVQEKQIPKPTSKPVQKQVKKSTTSFKCFAGSTVGKKDGPLLKAQFSYPTLMLSRGSKLYVIDEESSTIRMIENSKVSTISFFERSKISKKKKPIKISKISAFDISNDGIIVFDYRSNNLYKFTLEGEFIGRFNTKNYKLKRVESIAHNSQGEFYLSNSALSQIAKLEGKVFIKYSGKEKGYLDGPLEKALFKKPTKIVFDSKDTMYILDKTLAKVRVIKDETVTTLEKKGLLKNVSSLAMNKDKLYLYSSKKNALQIYDVKRKTLKSLGISSKVPDISDISIYKGKVIFSSAVDAKLYILNI